MADPSTLQPHCPPVHRPEALFDPATTVHGLRAAQARSSPAATASSTSGSTRTRRPPSPTRRVWTLTPAPGGTPVAVDRGRRSQALPTPHVELPLAGAPDPTRYRLEVDPPAPASRSTRCAPGCPCGCGPSARDLGSCFASAARATRRRRPRRVHDYLARDWRSLRQALLEYLLREASRRRPVHRRPDDHVLELFAHVGDLLHYRLDRVATEAYLETARLRTSVRRHARLVDFRLGEAVSRAHVRPRRASRRRRRRVAVAAGDVAADAPGSTLAFTLDGR